MFSPLEQFENHYIINIVFPGGCPVAVSSNFVTSVTTLAATSLMNVALIFGLLWLGLSNPYVLKPKGVQIILENWWSLLTGVIRQQLGTEQRFTVLFVWTFGWIAIQNLVGLIPLNFTTTSHLSTTLFLALSFNLGFFVWGISYHGFKFFGLFVPKGAPVALLPLIVLIEIVSYCIRPISLALRLFANMMAGHTLVHILIGFVSGLPLFEYIFVPMVVIFAVTLLEFGIALLQAYVFVVLCCIYVRDALEPGH